MHYFFQNGVCVGFIDFYRGLDWTSFVRNFSRIFLFSAKKHICWKANLLHILLKIMGKILVAYINCHPISRFSKVSRERVTLACGPCTVTLIYIVLFRLFVILKIQFSLFAFQKLAKSNSCSLKFMKIKIFG